MGASLARTQLSAIFGEMLDIEVGEPDARTPADKPSADEQAYGSRPNQRIEVAADTNNSARPPIAKTTVISRLRLTLPS